MFCLVFGGQHTFFGKSGFLEIRTDNLKGTLIGKIRLDSTASDFKEFYCKLNTIFFGKKDLYLIFKGSNDSVMQLDWFKFK